MKLNCKPTKIESTFFELEVGSNSVLLYSSPSYYLELDDLCIAKDILKNLKKWLSDLLDCKILYPKIKKYGEYVLYNNEARLGGIKINEYMITICDYGLEEQVNDLILIMQDACTILKEIENA